MPNALFRVHLDNGTGAGAHLGDDAHALRPDRPGDKVHGRALAARPVARPHHGVRGDGHEGPSIGQAICKKCKVIRRAGSCASCARTRGTSSARARAWHASPASTCRATSGWRSRSPTSTASAAAPRCSICAAAEVDPGRKTDDADRRRGHAHPARDRRELQGRGRPAPRRRRGTSSGWSTSAATAACATGATCRCAASARTPTRAPARARGATIAGQEAAAVEGLSAARRRQGGLVAKQQEASGAKAAAARRRAGSPQEGEAASSSEGMVHIHSTFNNTIITITDPQGNVVAWSSAGLVRLQGLAQGDAVRRAGGGRGRGAQGGRARHAARCRCS